MPIHVAFQGKPSAIVTPRAIAMRAGRMMRALQIEDHELSILLTDDKQIKILNRDYRKKNRPTDVLAFAMREGSGGHLAGRVLGDVIISLETAERQAPQFSRSSAEEVTFLLAHGLLHLLGWDHDTDAKERAMTKETKKLCVAAASAPKAATKTSPTRKKQGDRRPRGASPRARPLRRKSK